MIDLEIMIKSIARYNKNQAKFKATYVVPFPDNTIEVCEIDKHTSIIISYTTFLCASKYKFAYAFWGEKVINTCLKEVTRRGWRYHIQKLVSTTNRVKYLEQFLK